MPLPRAVAVVPCFNHGRFVADAVRSVLAQAQAQTRVVIVNDGSDDATTPDACDACRDLAPDPDRVTVVHQPNRGLPAARNAGARAAAERGWGEYLVFLDADDWIEPTFVSRLHAEIAAAGGDPSVSHAYCQERLVELGHGTWAVPEWDPVLLLITNLHPVTALIRRDRFEESGGFDESMRDGYEDWELWVRLAERGWRGVRVREPLFVWRRHSHTTMVMGAVTRHERLFRSIVERHQALYARHAPELVVRSNVLLRRADANWLDENLEAIFVRDLRAGVADLGARLEASRAEAGRLERALAEEAERVQALWNKPVVRASRAFHRLVDLLPAPVAWPARAGARGLKRLVSRPAR